MLAFAAGLSRLGLGRGERVAVYLDKRIETVVSLFGTSAAGGVFVPVNPLLRAQQVAYILDDCDVRVLVTSAERLALLRDELAPVPVGRARRRGRRASRTRRRTCPALVHGWDELQSRRAGAGAGRDRRRHGGDPLHVGQHRAAEGRRALAPQPDRRRRERQPVPRQPRGRRHPRRAAAQLRRRLQPAHDRRSRSAPTSCSSTTCCPATSSGCAPSTASPGSPASRRCGSSSPTRTGRPRPAASMRYFANTGGRMPQRDARPAARDLPAGRSPYLMYGLTEAFRSTYLDPGGGRPPPRLDRQGDPERRDPRRAPGRHAVRPRRGGRARAPRRAGRARLLERPGADRRAVQARARRASSAICTPEIGGLVRRPRRRATRRASSTSSAATTR